MRVRGALPVLLAWLALPVSGAADAAPESSPDDLLTKGRALYSQGKEELIIRHFFGDRRGGFFVDVGAYHWRRLSTTYYLERHLGWSGIAVDAIEDFAEGYAKNRPRTKFFSYIVTDHSGTEESFYQAHKAAKGLSSTSRSWVERLSEAFFPGADTGIEEIRVPTITLDELLERHGVEKIDLLSMDIEGGEAAALAGFDIERFRPELVCVEGRPEILAEYFGRHGYERIREYEAHDRANRYYKPGR